jgi:glycosyltransferase involved in cell wall biosynthesis
MAVEKLNRSNQDPDVSVVIPAYNMARFVGLSVESVLAQTDVSLEVIVVDDGSTDETPAALAAFGDRIRTIRIENSGGPSRPRNTAILAARGRHVAFLDADDIMLPGKLSAQVAALDNHPQTCLVFTDFRKIDTEGQVLDESRMSEFKQFRSHLQPLPDTTLQLMPAQAAYSTLLHGNFIGTSSVVCRRDAVIAAGLFDETLHNFEDRDLWFRMARGQGDLLFLDRVLHAYRKHGSGITDQGWHLYPAMIQSFKREAAIATAPRDRAVINRMLRTLLLACGNGLRTEGEYARARQLIAESWRLGASTTAALSWLRALLRI